MKRSDNRNGIPVRDCSIPDALRIKTEEAIRQIRSSQETNANAAGRNIPHKAAVVLLIACVLLIGAVTVYAAVNHFWSDASLDLLIQADSSQQQLLESRDRVDFLQEHEEPPISTVNDITVKPMELVADKYNASMTFIVCGPVDMISKYCRVVLDEYEFSLDNIHDGDLQYLEKAIKDKDGNEGLGFIIYLHDLARTGITLEGKTYHVSISKLTLISDEAEPFSLNGQWTIDIPMPEEISMMTCNKNQVLEGSGYTLTSVELSELSVKTDFILNNELPEGTEPTNVPRITAIRFRDGTVIDSESTNNEEGKLARQLQSGPGEYIYDNGLPYAPFGEFDGHSPIGGFSTAQFTEVKDPYDIVEIHITAVEAGVTPDTIEEKTHYYTITF